MKRSSPSKQKAKRQEVSAVISTAPVNILAKLVKGTDALKNVAQFRYRPMIFVNLRFEGRGLLPDTVLWFPENDFPFFRLTEATLSMPWLAPEGKTIITVDIGCEKDDEFWAMDEEKLTAALSGTSDANHSRREGEISGRECFANADCLSGFSQ